MSFFSPKRSVLILLFLTAACTPPQKSKTAKVTIWHWMIDRKDTLNELSRRYKEQTGVDVEFKLFFPPDTYSQKTIAAARAGTLPDIFGILGEKKTLGSFIKAGYILNLTPYMKEGEGEWENKFYPQTLGVNVFKKNNAYGIPEGIYGVPIDTTIMQFIYNKSLFKEAGLNPQLPPATFEEFLNDAKIIKEKLGVDGFVSGWGEGWLLNSLATEWAINLMGEEKFFKTIKGEVPYTDREWIKVFSLFERLRDSGVLVPNIATMINKESEDVFSKGKAAFSFNGSWAVNVYRQLSPELNYAFFPLPKVREDFPPKVWGGAGSSFMVYARSSRREEAVKFLQWLTSEKQQKFLIAETHNLPAIKLNEENFPPLLRALTNNLDNLTHPNIWPYNEDSRVIEVINRGLQQIVMGLKTPEEVAKEIQKKKERVLRK